MKVRLCCYPGIYYSLSVSVFGCYAPRGTHISRAAADQNQQARDHRTDATRSEWEVKKSPSEIFLKCEINVVLPVLDII